MKKKILLTTVLAALSLSIFALPNLRAFNTPMGDGKWWYRPAIRDKLELTNDQARKINRIWIEHRKRIIDLKGNLQKAYLDLEDLMSQPLVDKNQAYALAERLAQLQAKQTEVRIRMAIEIRQELSLDQYEKLTALRRELAKSLRKKGLRGEKRGKIKLN